MILLQSRLINIHRIEHQGERCIALVLTYDQVLMAQVKKIKGVRWRYLCTPLSKEWIDFHHVHRDIKTKKVTPPITWYSIPQHWHESEKDIHCNQDVQGHESIRTTKVYTHVTKDRKPASPLDTLVL